MRCTSELMQLETGMSISRYLPPKGTAGFARCRVSGYRRWPAPPPKINANTFSAAIGGPPEHSRNTEPRGARVYPAYLLFTIFYLLFSICYFRFAIFYYFLFVVSSFEY